MMSGAFNPLDHPVCLEFPKRLAASHWAEHTPFAMWLVSALRPRILVELGTFRGTSYCAFCQAIRRLGLSTRAFAVDTWTGDLHNGVTEPEVFAELSHYHDGLYSGFSTLLRMGFDAATDQFEDGSIDLLHIDGYHTYEAVRHDFETWLPKVSDRGVVLLHDCDERILDFGVYRFWDELAARFPSFRFHHEHGLGVLLVGPNPVPALQALVAAEGLEAHRIRRLFHELGRRVRLQMELVEQREIAISAAECHRDLERGMRELEQQVSHVTESERQTRAYLQTVLSSHSELERSCKLMQSHEARLQSDLQSRADQIADMQGSSAWRLACRVSEVSRKLAPVGSRRRGLILQWIDRRVSTPDVSTSLGS